MKYRLIVDSSCDLPKEIIGDYEFTTAPLIVQIGEKTFKDRIEINSSDILSEYDKTGILPKTSALNVGDLISFFTLEINRYDHIFFMPISSKVSSVYNNALLAVKEMNAEDKITVLDSKSLSSGSGLLALGILEDIKAELSVDDIVKNHNARAEIIKMSFVIDTMTFLYKGGRCSGMSYFIGNKFHIHPIIQLDAGKMSVHKLTRGKDVTKGLSVLIEEFKKDLENDNVDLSFPILIPNVESESGTKFLKHELSKIVGEKILFVTNASGIICCHCGRNTCGLAYMRKTNSSNK